MSEQDREYMRDLFAMFALAGLLMRGNNKLEQIASASYDLADDMMEAREPKATVGLPEIKRKARAK
jgi:hypothetical protein